MNPARLTQIEAMKYVHISSWSEFEKWRDLRGIPFTRRGRRTFYRIKSLDDAMVADEQHTMDAIRRGRECAEAMK